MTLYAHLDPADALGLRPVREIITVPQGSTLGKDFGSAEVAAACVACADTVVPGMVYDPASKSFAAPQANPADLPALKADLKQQVDARAEALRLTLITPGSGQAMEYQEAYAQAQAALDAGDAAKPADFPMLAVTIGVDIDPQTSTSGRNYRVAVADDPSRGGVFATPEIEASRELRASHERFLENG